MAQIAVLLDCVTANKGAIIQKLRSVVPIGITEATTAIGSGHPVILEHLFSRQKPDFAPHLLAFLEWLESQSLEYRAFQVLDHDRFELSRCDHYYMVNADRLRTIIATRAASLEEQRRLGSLE
jgi:hypothetical protein